MSARSDVTYVYDGSFEGLLTAVFESFESRELPCSIVAEDEFVPTLFACKTVDTDPEIKRQTESAAGSKMSAPMSGMPCGSGT